MPLVMTYVKIKMVLIVIVPSFLAGLGKSGSQVTNLFYLRFRIGANSLLPPMNTLSRAFMKLGWTAMVWPNCIVLSLRAS